MTELQIRAVLAGVFFGMWPLLMNRSGLTGNISAAVFSLGTFIVVLPFALRELGGSSTTAAWTMAVGACISGGVGLLLFTGVLAKATPQTVGPLFILMMVVQITVPALYQIAVNGGLTISMGIGFAAAVLAAFLLL